MFSFADHLSAVRNVIWLCFVVILLAGCGSRPEYGVLAINALPADGATLHDVLVVTTRQRDERKDTYFSGNRSENLNYAEATISVPESHQPGAIEWPDRLPGDPNKHFVARQAGYVESEADFLARLNAELRERPKGDREVFLFIHGYNTRFAEGLYRFTQFVHDAKFPGVPVLFTWASRGNLQGYIYDLNSAAIARDSLEHTLRLLAKSEAESISILAHSMGNWLLMETIRQIPPADRRKISRRYEAVALAAPDIDIDLFKANLRRIGRFRKPFVIIVSRDDGALKLSRRLAGGVDRLGAYANDEELAELGAIVIDLTELNATSTTSHSKFAELAQYSPEIRRAVLTSRLANGADIEAPSELGDNLGSYIGSTTQTLVTLPIKIVAAPLTLATGRR